MRIFLDQGEPHLFCVARVGTLVKERLDNGVVPVNSRQHQRRPSVLQATPHCHL